MIISNEAHVRSSFFDPSLCFPSTSYVVSYIYSRSILLAVVSLGFRLSKIAHCLRHHRLLYFITPLYFSHKMRRESFQAKTKWIANELDTAEFHSDRFRFHFLQTQCPICTAYKHVRKHVFGAATGHKDAPRSKSSFAAPECHPFTSWLWSIKGQWLA